MVYLLLGNGFEECEVAAPCTVLRRAGVEVRLAGIGGTCIEGARKMRLMADCAVSDISNAEMLILPGGLGGVAAIESCPEALEAIRAVYDRGGYLSAICAAPGILGRMGLLRGKRATIYPGMEEELIGATVCNAPVVVSGKIVTARAAGSAFDFALELLRLLRGDAAARQMCESIVYSGGFQ